MTVSCDDCKNFHPNLVGGRGSPLGFCHAPSYMTDMKPTPVTNVLADNCQGGAYEESRPQRWRCLDCGSFATNNPDAIPHIDGCIKNVIFQENDDRD